MTGRGSDPDLSALFDADGKPRTLSAPGERVCLVCEMMTDWRPCAYHERERSLGAARGLFQTLPPTATPAPPSAIEAALAYIRHRHGGER